MAQLNFNSLAPAGLPAPARGSRGSKWRPKARTLERIRSLAPLGFAYTAALSDAFIIFVTAYCANMAYHMLTFGWFPGFESAAIAGCAVAVMVVGTSAQRGEYTLEFYRRKAGQAARAFGAWNLVFLVMLAFGFTTKTTSDFSRGAVTVFYLIGYPALVMNRRLVVDLAHYLLEKRMIQPRRLVIVGFEDRLADIQPKAVGFDDAYEIVNMIALRDNQAYIADDLALASAALRMHRADDVCLAVPWHRHDVIEAANAAFLRTPAEIHLDADRLLEHFSHVRFTNLGPVSGLRVTRPKLTRIERLEKRTFDLVVSCSALAVLSPILIAVAIAIRLESKGPSLFRQTRYGFNQEPFKIFKFRSMRTMEDGRKVVAAKRDDPRVTRLGAYLRKLSVDELPQLLNVVRGDMSIVGPRPHAMSHDQRYFERLSRYARRHNVKPGITGWAQVHGHRGEIANDQQMLSRLEHDLFYVDNWSLWLDIKIVLLTVFSRKAHSNAF